MTYIAAADRYDAMHYRRCGRSGLKLPRSRSASGTTSATTARSRPSARSCAAPSTSASPTSTWPTTTARPTARRRATSAASSREDLAALPRRAGHLDQGRLRHVARPVRRVGLAQVPARQPRPEPAAHGPRLRRHLLLAPLRPGHAARGDDGRARHRRPPGQGALRRHLVLLGRADRARRRRSCASSARRCSSTSRPTRCSTAGSRTDLLDVLERGGRRLHRVLAARAGPAHRPLPRRHPGGLAGRPRAASSTATCSPRRTSRRVRALNEIAQRPRPVARADGARLGAARPAGDLGADRRQQRRAARGERRARSTTSSFSRRRARRRSTGTRSTPASTSGRSRAALDSPHRAGL